MVDVMLSQKSSETVSKEKKQTICHAVTCSGELLLQHHDLLLLRRESCSDGGVVRRTAHR